MTVICLYIIIINHKKHFKELPSLLILTLWKKIYIKIVWDGTYWQDISMKLQQKNSVSKAIIFCCSCTSPDVSITGK
jgi:hypothetical protein